MKNWLESKTICGLLTLAIGWAIGKTGLDDAGLTTDIVLGYVRQLMEIGGFLLAVYGRWKAQGPLKVGR